MLRRQIPRKRLPKRVAVALLAGLLLAGCLQAGGGTPPVETQRRVPSPPLDSASQARRASYVQKALAPAPPAQTAPRRDGPLLALDPREGPWVVTFDANSAEPPGQLAAILPRLRAALAAGRRLVVIPGGGSSDSRGRLLAENRGQALTRLFLAAGLAADRIRMEKAVSGHRSQLRLE